MTLPPIFEAMPPELRALPRWVVWKGRKVPFNAEARDSTASVTDPDTWASFSAAQSAYYEGSYSGVGFVLDGDGVAGVDLDNCVLDGKPSSEALALLGRIGCQYIEFSPSGSGLHGIGYAYNIKGRRGRLGGLSVELYATERYFTMTGHTLQPGPLVRLPGFAEVAGLLEPPTSTEDAQKVSEEHLSHLLSSSVGLRISGFPPGCFPKDVGERNSCLFALARYVKGVRPDATYAERRTIAQTGHQLMLPAIGTKDSSVTIADFERAWKSVKYPHGGPVLQPIIDAIDPATLPAGIGALGYGPVGNHLVRICAALQAHEGSGPFFLGARQAGDLIGMHYTEAAKMLATLRNDGVLELVEKGAGHKASRYRYVWGRQPMQSLASSV